MIYHIVKTKEFQSCIDGVKYIPSNLKDIGFIHCSLESSVIPVANDYYGNVLEELLLLRIEPLNLESQVKYEAAKPENGINTSHLSSSPIFPHIYGPVDLIAINGIGILEKKESGYIWPKEFEPKEKYLHKEM
jgi:uncharacterized protein (DUF952 family)